MTKTLEWQPLWDMMEANPNEWIPTTENMYWQMLEVLPPEKMINGNFLVGEAANHNSKGEAVFACFTKFGDTYKARYLTLAEFMREHGFMLARELR